MDRRSLFAAGIAGAAGFAVGNEFGAAPAGAAADVDRAEFDALMARVAYLESFHPPMPTTTTSTTTTAPPHVPKFSGVVSLPDGFVVPFGEVWDFDPDVSTTVTVSKNVVVAGVLQMRPANPGVVHTLRFVGVDELAFIGGGMDPIDSDVGLWVIGAGVLDAVGAPKTSWARAASDIAVGAEAVTLHVAADGWQVGDEVAITPTGPTTQTNSHDRYDVRTITGSSGPTVTLSAPCGNAHPRVDVGDGMVFGAEVLNLTRNVRIEGTPTGRAHVFCSSGSAQTLSNVQFRHMGPRKPTGEVTALGPVTANVLGRYPFHMHMMGAAASGSTLTGCVSRDSGGHGFVVHGSHGVTLDACIAHDVFDDAFWWDILTSPDPSSNAVTYSRCVASRVKCDPSFRGIRLAGFTFTQGTGCAATNCVAVGVQGNNNAAGFSWPEGAEAVWTFTRNVSHNNKVNGLFAWQNGASVHPVGDFACYHNGAFGIDHGAYLSAYRYDNGWLYGNGAGSIRLHSMSRIEQLAFTRLRCDAVGLHATPVQFAKHNLDGAVPVFFGGLEFIGHTGTNEFAATNTEPGRPTLVDVVECGAVDVAWSPQSKPESVVRTQAGDAATRWTPASAALIAPFSTYAPTPRTPFAVLAAA